jgi:hypothetical protein
MPVGTKKLLREGVSASQHTAKEDFQRGNAHLRPDGEARKAIPAVKKDSQVDS